MDSNVLSVSSLLDQPPERFGTNTALVVVDPQNAFLHNDGSMAQLGLPIQRMQDALSNLLTLVHASRAAGLPLFVLQMWIEDYAKAGILLEHFPPLRDLKHCEADSWDAAFAEQIAVAPEDTIVRHSRFSGFHSTQLETVVTDKRIDSIILAGFATNTVLESTARSAFDRDLHVYIPKETTASYTEEMEGASLLNLGLGIARIVSLQDTLTSLRRSAEAGGNPASAG